MEKLLKLGRFSDGSLKEINEVANGLACGCYCPGCGSPLVAKNSIYNVKEAHFAHASGSECKGAVETALHKLAKQVFAEVKALLLPAYHYDYNHLNPKTEFGNISQLITFDRVEIEKSIEVNGVIIRPDAIGYKEGKRILIEFAKTHFVEPEKERVLKQSGFSSIELDLNCLEQSKEAVKSFLLSTTYKFYKSWLSNPVMDKIYEKYCNDHLLKQAEEEKARQVKLNEQRLLLKTIKEKEKNERLEKIRKYRLNKDLQQFGLLKKDLTAFNCPLKKEKRNKFLLTDYYKAPIIKRIIDGEFWNGRFYGYPPNGKWIFLKSEKIIVYPPFGKELPNTRFSPNSIFRGLNFINEEGLQTKSGNCINCPYAVERFEEELIQVCKYPKL